MYTVGQLQMAWGKIQMLWSKYLRILTLRGSGISSIIFKQRGYFLSSWIIFKWESELWKMTATRTSLVVQQLRPHLPVQGRRVRSLDQETINKIPHAAGQLSLCTATIEPTCSHMPQLERTLCAATQAQCSQMNIYF